MGSTTYREYRHFERDRALARRFQRIDVHEPSVADTVKILEGLRAALRGAPRRPLHEARALKGAAELAAQAHHRPLPARQGDRRDRRGRRGGEVAQGQDGRGQRTVGLRDIEATVARMARIPLARASASDRARLEHLEDDLQEGRVRAGRGGRDGRARGAPRARRALAASTRPIGSFLFMGPTGVGKTELAKQLANCLGVPFLRFDMSEYMEKHAVARLIGAPPGYVGYDEGGQLVEKIRKQPYAVLLLDEIEKAHPDLFDILLQVMDHATLTDNQGREADFRHVTLIMTSNVGARDMQARAIGFGDERRGDGKKDAEKLFSPEFRNRLDEIVTFRALDPSVMERVVDKFVARGRRRSCARRR